MAARLVALAWQVYSSQPDASHRGCAPACDGCCCPCGAGGFHCTAVSVVEGTDTAENSHHLGAVGEEDAPIVAAAVVGIVSYVEKIVAGSWRKMIDRSGNIAAADTLALDLETRI